MKNKFEALEAFRQWSKEWQSLCIEYWLAINNLKLEDSNKTSEIDNAKLEDSNKTSEIDNAKLQTKIQINTESLTTVSLTGWKTKIVKNEEEFWTFAKSLSRNNYKGGCGPESIKPVKYPCIVTMLPQQELYDDATTSENTIFAYFD